MSFRTTRLDDQFALRTEDVLAQDSQAAVVFAALFVTALFQPLRARMQTLVDRRFYRRKYDAQRTLASFSATVRDEVELDNLAVRLVDVARETVQPTLAFLWLRPTADRRKPISSQLATTVSGRGRGTTGR